jgi:hypothetical protein
MTAPLPGFPPGGGGVPAGASALLCQLVTSSFIGTTGAGAARRDPELTSRERSPARPGSGARMH